MVTVSTYQGYKIREWVDATFKGDHYFTCPAIRHTDNPHSELVKFFSLHDLQARIRLLKQRRAMRRATRTATPITPSHDAVDLEIAKRFMRGLAAEVTALRLLIKKQDTLIAAQKELIRSLKRDQSRRQRADQHRD